VRNWGKKILSHNFTLLKNLKINQLERTIFFWPIAIGPGFQLNFHLEK
jgi:hypothetical protein